MSTLLGAVLLLITGPGFLAWGVWILRSGAWQESIPLAEVLIDRALGVEPPPRNKWDQRFARLQAWFLVAFGTFVSFGFVALLIADLVSE